MATLAELLASTKTKQSDGMRLSAMLDIAKRAKADAQGKSVQDMIAEVPASVYNNPIANAAIGFTPVIGDIQSGVEALRSAAAGRWGEAALNGVGVLPFVPTMAGMIKQKHIDEILSAIRQSGDGGVFGLRTIPGEASENVKLGDVLNNSFRWKNGNQTEKQLSGTSTIGVLPNDESIINGLKKIGADAESKGPYYFGDQVVLVKGQKAKRGQDVGESVIESPTVIWTGKKKTKGRSDLED